MLAAAECFRFLAASAETVTVAVNTATADKAISDRKFKYMAFFPDPSCRYNCRSHANHGTDHKPKFLFVIPPQGLNAN